VDFVPDYVLECFEDFVKGPIYVERYCHEGTTDNYVAQALLGDLVVGISASTGGSPINAEAQVELLKWKYSVSTPVKLPGAMFWSGQCVPVEGPAPQVGPFPWTEGIADWQKFMLIDVGIKDGKLCQKYNRAWRCYRNGEACMGLLPDDEVPFTYNSCPTGWGATTPPFWQTPTQAEKLGDLVDTSKCAIAPTSSDRSYRHCLFEGRVAEVALETSGSAQVDVYSNDGMTIGFITLDEYGELEKWGTMPDGTVISEGLSTTIIIVIVVVTVVVVGAAVGVGLVCYYKNKKPVEAEAAGKPPAVNADP
jgi:hypothetical protein